VGQWEAGLSHPFLPLSLKAEQPSLQDRQPGRLHEAALRQGAVQSSLIVAQLPHFRQNHVHE
jgi:hypothetical protein